VSPPLDPVVVSSGGQGPLVVGAHQEAFPYFFYILQVPVMPPQGRSTVVSPCVERALGSLKITLCGADLQPHARVKFPAYGASQKERDGFCKTASCLLRVPLACHSPLSSEDVCL